MYFFAVVVLPTDKFLQHIESPASHPGFGLSILALPHLITKAQLLQRDSAMDNVSST